MKTNPLSSKLLGIVFAASFLLTNPCANATVYDLTTAPVTGVTLPDGSIFQINDPQSSTGTGVIGPFLRLQANGSEQGYNSSNNANFDTKTGIWTHDLQIGDLKAALNNPNYVSFLVDVNQTNSNPNISLDRLQIWASPTQISSSQSINTTDSNGNFNGSLGTLLWTLDNPAWTGNTDNSILYTDGMSGSGSGDIRFFVPASIFYGLPTAEYIYMYQQWGTTSGYQTNGGFEETYSIGQYVIPEASSLIPLGLVMAFGIGLHCLRRRSSPAVA